ncbi:DeoR/GlpR family DNA-binding transcription regulator [Siphonobacter curvatus]|uniref:DeoR/GlpR transcriptional regulator n=1 Tax=Siphonobacter curvatus TaxID=2094562 RepID=A0A2S7IL75_9BACT|nr:DeoR/GlpR family DNA-binding transcription regulator [Siphonobacter curvatus]PQA58406.1 DeoR/GlpR transcriptional regulator [Siphonobacter curvatus]
MSITRHKQILEYLAYGNERSVSFLAEQLQTSEITIRRDLNTLAEQGKLIRTHGGATRNDLPFVPFTHKSVIHTQAKKQIGQRAATLVEENDVLFLDCGSTVLAMGPYLKTFRNLKIITNSLPLIWELREAPHLSINLIGGELDVQRQAVHGSVALEHVARYHADKAFLGVDGISLKNGLTARSETEASFTKALLANAERSVLLADLSKFEQDSYLKFAPLSAIHYIITRAGLDENLVQQYREAGCEWIEA